jgi:hypothetical protein
MCLQINFAFDFQIVLYEFLVHKKVTLINLKMTIR